jgi:hypothetical protein
MVKVGFAENLGERFKATFPKALMRPVGPDFAAAAIVRGIERQAPRIIAPRRWVPLSVLRGLLNPLLDRRAERNALIHGVVRDADVPQAAPAELTAAPSRSAGAFRV